MAFPNGDGKWITVEFDLHKGFKTTEAQHQAAYEVVYGQVGNRAIKRTGSTFQAYAEYAPVIRLALSKAEAILADKGIGMTVYCTPLSPSADDMTRARGVGSLVSNLVKVGASLAERVAKLDAEFAGAAADVNALLRKGSLALSKARRGLEDARALAVAYGLTEDIATAFSATAALIEAESRKRELVKATRSALVVKAAAQGLELIEELDG